MQVNFNYYYTPEGNFLEVPVQVAQDLKFKPLAKTLQVGSTFFLDTAQGEAFTDRWETVNKTFIGIIGHSVYRLPTGGK